MAISMILSILSPLAICSMCSVLTTSFWSWMWYFFLMLLECSERIAPMSFFYCRSELKAWLS